MNGDRWRRVEDLFHQAADLAPAERAAFLDGACTDDEELRREVESLLAVDSAQDGFLRSAVAQASNLISTEPDEGAAWTGKHIGHYLITGLIGKGGMGSVYHAVRDDEFRMQVALKLLSRGTDTEAALSRFRAERRILAGLQHPNVARLLDGGATESGLPYFVMEYVDGRPLLEYASPLSIHQRLELFRSVCAAVQYAHQNLVVHRDLKPGNILVTADGVPKLLDFGIAKLLDPEAAGSTMTLTGVGVRLMTPDYASPEQVRGEPVTTATDVYSLGVVLYELLTGGRPHHIESSSPTAIERAICLEEPKKPSSLNRHLDPDLDNIVLLALRKELQRRYASVEQFSEDIRRYLEGRPVQARKDTFGYRANKFIRRNKVGMVIAALILIGAVTGVVAVDRQARRAEYRFRQVRKLANTVLFDLNPEIENLAGSTRARELLVKTSLEYLDSLAAEASDDPTLQLDLATAYEKIGDVQGLPRYSNLGHPEAALQSYAKAAAIARKLGPSERALEVLARSYGKTGTIEYFELNLFTAGREHLNLAAGIADSIPATTGQPAYDLRKRIFLNLGDLDLSGDPESAKEAYRRAIEIAREGVAAQGTPENRFFLATAMARSGMSLKSTGDLAGALETELGALKVINELLERQPENVAWRQQRNFIWGLVGSINYNPGELNLGDRKAAATWLQRVVDDSERLLAADSSDNLARFDVGDASAELAGVISESNPKRAEQLYRRALSLSTSALRSLPADSGRLEELSLYRLGYATVLSRLGKRSQALAEVQTAVETLERLNKSSPPGQLGFQQSLEIAVRALAAHHLGRGDPEGSERELQRALGLIEPLYRDHPRNLKLLRDLAECYQGFGDLSVRRSDWKQARVWYQKSLDLWERWKQVGASSVYDRQRRDLAARLVAQAAKNSSKNSVSH
jgi:tetratricopeptide (TPR) repeat protein